MRTNTCQNYQSSAAVNKLPYVVHNRKDSSNFWMRFSITGHGQQCIALRTADILEANEIAEKKYQEVVFKAKHGILEGITSFDRLAKEFVDSLYREAESLPNRLSNAKYAKRICERYLKGYFGNKPIRSITEPSLYAYLEWRKEYWISGPGKDVLFIEYERCYKTLRRPANHIEPSQNTLKREANVTSTRDKHLVFDCFEID